MTDANLLTLLVYTPGGSFYCSYFFHPLIPNASSFVNFGLLRDFTTSARTVQNAIKKLPNWIQVKIDLGLEHLVDLLNTNSSCWTGISFSSKGSIRR